MENRPHFWPPRGFTLLEMMVTVAVVGILLAIGVPSFRYVANVNRIAAEANNLLGDMQFARSEAIKEGQSVSICVSSDVNTVTPPTKPSCVASTNWALGWVVFSNINGNGTIDNNDIVLRTSNKLSSSDTLSTATLSIVTFNREGFAAALSGAHYWTLHAPTTGNNWTRCVRLTLVGMTSVIPYDGTNCT